MSASAKEVDAYLSVLSDEIRVALEKVRKAIRSTAPKAEECISYQIPAYKQNGLLVGFAASSKHCTFHVMSPTVLSAHKAEVKGFKLNKASICFTPDKPPSAALIKKLTKARIVENESARKPKTGKQ